jgi:undecaprenyl phosphate N,N'-diacetylbacillosamine 1-phosphate transferase
MKKNLYTLFFKRFLDFFGSFFAIVIISPLLILIAFLVKIFLGSPIIFKQPRPGLNEKIFNLYKFRSMTFKSDNDGNLLSDDLRLTKFGKFLRSTSLDELPNLFNILIGKMSFIGPRPLLIEYLEIYTPLQKNRHNVKPGLTGLAQVNGRNSLSWEEKINLDLKYIQHLSFSNDLKIFLKTFSKVLKREGINFKDSQSFDNFINKNKD